MPRILHIIDSLARTGTAAQLLAVAQALADDGFDVHIACLGRQAPLAPEFRAAGLPVADFDRRWPLDPLADLGLWRHVVRLRPKIVHTWNTVPGMFGPAAAAVFHRAGPGAAPILVAGYQRINPRLPAWEWILARRLSQGAARFVGTSRAVQDWATSHGLPAEKFAIIPRGVPAARASDVSRGELLAELRLHAEARIVGIIGPLVPEKRVKDLIWAADLLRVLHDELRVLIIGDGPQHASLLRYAELASDLDHIRFLGERADVWRILPHLDVLWNGGDRETQSMAILEAMAAGVPVVAGDTLGNAELVLPGETGYLVPLGRRAGRAARARHTDQILNDPALAARLGATARERARLHFSLDACASRHRAMYQELLDRHPRGRP